MKFETIIVPTKLQTDTIVAIFILKKFGEEKFPGIENAKIKINSIAPTEDQKKEPVIFIDIGGGEFDHHLKPVQTTASKLVIDFLNLSENVALKKMQYLAERCDFFGKGIISKDQIDRTFGLPGLIVSVNKLFDNDPQKVFEAFQPILEGHYREENKRAYELPETFKQKIKNGQARIIDVEQKGKKINVVMLDSDDQSMSGYLRSIGGGNFDVVALWLSSGHCNIITKTSRKIDLRSLAALIRKSEAIVASTEVGDDLAPLAVVGRIENIPEWYYDPATNSIQNGGINPQGVEPTKISKDSMFEIIKLGLAETLWRPE